MPNTNNNDTFDMRDSRLISPGHDPEAEARAIAARISAKQSNPADRDVMAAVGRVERMVSRLDDHLSQVAMDIGSSNGAVRGALEAWHAETQQEKVAILRDRLPELASVIVGCLYAEAEDKDTVAYEQRRVVNAVRDGFETSYDGDHKSDGEVAISDEVAGLIKALTTSLR